MPRKARILVPNCPHHLVQRGHNRKTVFLEARDYRYYLDNLKEWKQKLEIKIYAWCLMTNHIHLIAEPGSDAMTIAQLMKRLNGRQRDRISGAGSGLLDEHECYRRLGRSSTERASEYVAFLSENIPAKETEFISDVVTRNQLTGNERFVDEIEHRIELRVLNRGRGRSVTN